MENIKKILSHSFIKKNTKSVLSVAVIYAVGKGIICAYICNNFKECNKLMTSIHKNFFYGLFWPFSLLLKKDEGYKSRKIKKLTDFNSLSSNVDSAKNPVSKVILC